MKKLFITLSVNIKCNQCDFTTKTEYRLKTHVYNKHDEKTEDFLCDSCEYKANTKRKLKRHVENSHTSTNVKTFHCNDCNSNFRNLKQHIINVHGERIHKCDQCDYIGKSRKYLSEHVVGVHGEKQLCVICVTIKQNIRLLYQSI